MESMEAKEVVVERAYSIRDVLVNVVILTIEARSTSRVLDLLCDAVSLSDYGLLHLKRVRKMASLPAGHVQVIFCPVSQLNGLLSHCCEAVKQLYLDNERSECEVVRVPPETKKEFQEWNAFWPMNFHPGELDRQRDKGFSAEEQACLQQSYVALTQCEEEFSRLPVAKEEGSILQGFSAVIVNPLTGQVVCSSLDAAQRLASQRSSSGPSYAFLTSPVLTPTMLCIDQVAAIARGSAVGTGSLPIGHYLCTGLDLYVMREPDLMSCMALVHSRIRRVFFVHTQPESGALQSGNGHIHSLKALNHHYRVFQLIAAPVNAQRHIND